MEKIIEQVFQEITREEFFDFLYQLDRYKFLLNRIGKNIENKRLLDVGSGLMHLAMITSLSGAETFTIDAGNIGKNNSSITARKKLNIDLTERAKKFRIKTFTADVQNEKLPFEDNYFDYVILAEVIEHFWCSPLFCLKEIKRVLKKDGILIVTTPNVVNLTNRLKFLFGKNVFTDIKTVIEDPIYSFHHQEYTLKNLLDLFSAARLKVNFFIYYSPFLKRYVPGLSRPFLEYDWRLKLIAAVVRFFPSLKQSIYFELKK